LLLAGCAPSEPQKQEDSFSRSCVLWVPPIVVGAPPTSETPLQHWQRAKRNWEEANKYYQEAVDKLGELTTEVVIDDYVRAEKDLEKAQCKDVCKPGAP
jgi:hypothetical protein